MEFDEVVEKRYSLREFKDKIPNWRDIIDAVDIARKIPLAGNIPSIKFIIVDDAEKIAKISKSTQQDFILDSYFVIVVCSDVDDVVKSYDERGEIYSRQQAGAAIETLILKLTELGLGSCWVGGFVDEQIKRILKIPSNVNVEAVIPVGYEIRKGKAKRKPSLDRCLYFNEYKGKFMKPKKIVGG